MRKGNNCEREKEYRTFLMSLKKRVGERERKIIINLQLLEMGI
jgi:hypothetical protein